MTELDFAERIDTRELSFNTTQEFKPVVTVDRTHLPVALRHGMELYWDDSSPKKRLDDRGTSQFTRFVNARVEGKIAEVAFSIFLFRYFGIDSQVDWRIYGDYEVTDDGDLQYIVGEDGEQYKLATDLDVKKTKPYNQWLAIREEIFENKLDDDAPIVLAKHQIKNDLDVDDWANSTDWNDVDDDDEFRDRLLEFADEAFPVRVTFTGTAYKDEFTDRIAQGERLYDPDAGSSIGPPMKRDNRGIHVSDLRNTVPRWNRIVEDVVGDNPIDWRPIPVVDKV
jgi:hypothetical protein